MCQKMCVIIKINMNPPGTRVTQVGHARTSEAWEGLREAGQASESCMTGQNLKGEHNTDHQAKL